GAGLKTRAVPHTSGSAHVPLVDKGQLTFGVNTTQQISAGVAGTAQFKGRATKNWVIAARLVPLPVGVLVKKSSPYHTLRDLKGKRLTVGYTAQKTVLFVLNGFLLNAGMNESDFKGVKVPNTSAGAQLFVKGQVDASFSSLGGARLRRADAKVGGIRILGMFNTPKAVVAMQKGYPNSHLIQLKPGKRSIGVEKPIWVMAFDMVLMTSTKTPDEVVYKSVKALYGGKAGLVKISPVFKRFKPRKMIPEYKGVKLHPGALKFYSEVGLRPKG
ncbi:MAG: TAXI family TRAP transporter solute-binding subunit, partial [Alphaproteobacteria bacterium]